jgi:Dullard-like phosphatase family protein
VYRTLKSIVPLKKLNYKEILDSKKVFLPELQNSEKHKKTLILDLDETLIHADFDNNFFDHDALVSFEYNDNEVTVPIFIRPGLFEFLEAISKKFEIFIFTASLKEYADSILNFLDPENKYFKNRFYRNNCICVKNKVFIKDLRIFANRKPENIVIVDNSLYSFTNQISNGVLINSFYNDKEDKELLNVLNYLLNYLQNISDVRSINDKVFNFTSIMDELMVINTNKGCNNQIAL